MLTDQQLAEFYSRGHVTVSNVFSASEIDLACADLFAWQREFLETLPNEERDWYLEQGAEATLRKLDHPVFYRPTFRKLATSSTLRSIVEQILGTRPTIFFSQVFLKPPEVGGPKPVHQDNFYFGPDFDDAMLTVWIAIDEATVENGCLFYGDGSHREGVVPHWAPEDEPFNLQANKEAISQYELTPAPVPRGGVSLHHGNTLHQSAANRSNQPRRATAIHFLRQGARLTHPALKYDDAFRVEL